VSVPDKSSVKVQPEILEIFLGGVACCLYGPGGMFPFYMVNVNAMWTDLDFSCEFFMQTSIGFLAFFSIFEPLFIAVRFVCSFYEAMAVRG
jgi:hypothetical protein